MSRKTLTKPVPNRHPTSDDIDTFVRGGGMSRSLLISARADGSFGHR